MTQLNNTTGASAPPIPFEGAGVRDTFVGTANPIPLGPSTPGYCYLEWFRPEHHATIATKVGYNPWVPAVAAMMLANTGLLTPNRMRLTTAQALPTAGDKFTQWHITPDPVGINVREFLALGLGAARLGGDTQRSAPEELLHVGRSTLTTSAGPAPRRLTLPFAATLQNDQAISVRLPAVPSWTTLLSPYESVVLIGFQFSADISGDESSVLRFRVATENTLANSRSAWLSAFYAKRFSGTTGASMQGVWRLPADHPYGTELKATTLGTDPPVFQFHFAGASGDAEITGHLTVEPRGAAPPRPVTFNPTAHALT